MGNFAKDLYYGIIKLPTTRKKKSRAYIRDEWLELNLKGVGIWRLLESGIFLIFKLAPSTF